MGFLINFMSYLYLISFSIFTAKAQGAQRKDTFLLPLTPLSGTWTPAKEKTIATRYFWALNDRQ
jgi:hypothetical protein